jgi:flagellin-like protein
MRRFRGSSRALSEIVGTLMLVLIVVVAATSFAVFIQAYQKQVQAQQAYAHLQHLESLRILSVVPTANATNPAGWATLNFSAASENINPSTITGLLVNAHAVSQYQVWRVDPSTGLSSLTIVAPGSTLALSPREQVNIVLTVSASPAIGSFTDLTWVPSTTSYLQLSAFTQLQNDFIGLFLPPTSVAIISTLTTFSGGVLQTVPVLDGSHSFQTGNSTLVAWSWKIYETTPTPGQQGPYLGEQIVAASYFASGAHYNVVLNVTNNDGLTSSGSIVYVAP